MSTTAAAVIAKIPADVRPIVQAARRVVRGAAPKSAREIPYNGKRPSSKSFMWKLVRYAVGDDEVLGIGTFTRHSAIFFYRGRQLDDPEGLLAGRGKDARFVTLRSVADAERASVRRLVQQAFKQAGSS